MKKLKIYLTALVLLLAISHLPAANKFILKKPSSKQELNFSGDNQFIGVGDSIAKPLRVQVVNSEGRSIEGMLVVFEVVSFPEKAKGARISRNFIRTDSLGYAIAYFTAGDQDGEYEVAAKINAYNSTDILLFKVNARKKEWLVLLIIGMLGGLGLFLFGMNLMSGGLQKSAGDRMRSILGKLTKNRLIALSLGAFVTMIIQSSSATTVMLVSFVQSGLMKFRRTIGVMLGAAIGTTITAQLIAFKMTDYALAFVAIGAAILFFSKANKLKNIGEALLGFGLLFFGMYIMSKAMYPLRTYEPFIELLLKMENPLLGMLVGAIFTALIQSSSASIGVLIILASQGLLSLEASIPLVIGANLGTAITAVLASLNTNKEAKKVAYAHVFIKFIGLLIFMWWIPYFAHIVEYISPQSKVVSSNQMEVLADVVPRQVANAHTIFNLILAVMVLPATELIGKIIDRIFPAKEDMHNDIAVQYINPALLITPAIALSAAKQEIVRMQLIVQSMVKDIVLVFLEKDSKLLESILFRENQVDFLRDKVKEYLISISQNSNEDGRVNEAFQMMYTIKEVEQIADIISKNLFERANKWLFSDKEFSVQGKAELLAYQEKALKQISRSIEVFQDVNLEKAQHMKNKFKKYSEYARELERRHYERLAGDVEDSIKSSKAHLEIIDMLKHINSHATNIARILLEWNTKQVTDVPQQSGTSSKRISGGLKKKQSSQESFL